MVKVLQFNNKYFPLENLKYWEVSNNDNCVYVYMKDGGDLSFHYSESPDFGIIDI